MREFSVRWCLPCLLAGTRGIFFFDLGMLADVLDIPPDRFNIKAIFAFKRSGSEYRVRPTLGG